MKSAGRFSAAAVTVMLCASTLGAQDPRVGLKAGMNDAAVAAKGMELVSSTARPQGFFDPANAGNILFANSDMAFAGNLALVGSFRGFQFIDISNPAQPVVRTSFVCPGGQGDLSVYGKLLFMSVEMPNGLVDCGEGDFTQTASPNHFRGVRIFDISDLSKPKQVATVQTCRGSHTHTLVVDPKDKDNVYIYVSGTSGVRPAEELAGCSGQPAEKDPNTSLFRIEVIKVPLAHPQDAKIVSTPRVFADPKTGAIAGLWAGGAHGEGTQSTATTNQCHDITVYSAIGLAAGACSGNGILLDISDPVNPRRIAEVTDPNFAYWHSATFNNEGTKVIYTDEWGGGMAPRCLATDRREWGADAIFELTNRQLRQVGYYKLPAPQTETENCVAHNGNLIPVPGRDLMVQGWYQGGVSVFDFTDGAKPVEIAYFDRGPYSASELELGGVWSAYWYNGLIYASEIGRGLDVFKLTPGELLSQNEIDAAKLMQVSVLNPQNQQRYAWPASFAVARAYLDQLRRGGNVAADRLNALNAGLDRAEKISAITTRRNLLNKLSADAKQMAGGAKDSDAKRLRALADALSGLATMHDH